MDKDNPLIQVTPEDVAFLRGELDRARRPFRLREMAEKLAFLKTASQRTREVKIYDSNCAYEVGDSVYKEYDEDLVVGSKVHERFQGAVVLTVVAKTPYKAYDCEMLEVDFTGGGPFRKYVDYQKKTKTQVLLPSNCGGGACAPKIMPREEDPRLTELPMTDRDLRTIERNLKTVLGKDKDFFSWGDHWQLGAAQPPITEDQVREIAARLAETKASASTGELVRAVFGLEPSHDLFDIHCLALDHLLETKHKKEFVLVQPLEWGRWHLKSVLNAMPEGLPLSAPASKLPEFEGHETIPVTPFHEFPVKVYLSWREILSGGVKLPKSFHKELSSAREYIFTDADENRSYVVYYFPLQGFFLGLREYFESHNVPQGTSLTLEKKGPVQFHFWLKKAKKRIGVARMAYDQAADTFADAGEVSTLALPNKIIYLERDQLARLIALYPEREGRDLRDLLILVFKGFSLASAGYALHYLRAYHLVDVLRRTSQEDVEFTLINTPEFEKSDKKKGIFYYHEAPPPKIEIAAEVEVPAPEAAPMTMEEVEVEFRIVQTPEEMALAEAGVTGEPAELAEAAAELEAFEAEKKPKEEKPAAPAAAPAKKEKEKKKPKKGKSEAERARAGKKSERRVKEEEIQELESEKEALHAVKEAEEEEPGAAALFEAPVEEPAAAKPGAPPKAKRGAKRAAEDAFTFLEAGEEAAAPAEEAGPAEPKPVGPLGAFGGMFADKLKTALQKKRQEAAQESEEEGAPGAEAEPEKEPEESGGK